MTDLERVAKLFGLNISQSAENTYITYGQGENTREMLEGINKPSVTPVKPIITLIYTNSTTKTSSDADTEIMRGGDYIQAVGCLLWIANGTRPDISYAVSQVSRFLEHPGLKH